MKIIQPTTLTTAMLVSSTVPEADYPAWSAGTAYSVADKVIRTSTHRIYQRLVAGTTATAPESDAVNWLDIAPTNRWAKYDDKVGTVTTAATTMTDVLTAGSVGGIALFELVGRTGVVSMKDAPGGTTVYSRTLDLDGTIVLDVFDWFFADYEQLSDIVLTDLPAQFTSAELTVTITATSGNVSCGVCKPGLVIDIGNTLAGAKVGIINYDGKDTDVFGNVYIVSRTFSKRGSFDVVTQKASFNRIFRRLAALRGTPCIYVGTESAGMEPLLIYGFFRDFSIDVAYFSHHHCSLEIEGLI
jgi:hypothetical protein